MLTAESPPAWGFGSAQRQVITRKDRDSRQVAPGKYDNTVILLKKDP